MWVPVFNETYSSDIEKKLLRLRTLNSGTFKKELDWLNSCPWGFSGNYFDSQ